MEREAAAAEKAQRAEQARQEREAAAAEKAQRAEQARLERENEKAAKAAKAEKARRDKEAAKQADARRAQAAEAKQAKAAEAKRIKAEKQAEALRAKAARDAAAKQAKAEKAAAAAAAKKNKKQNVPQPSPPARSFGFFPTSSPSDSPAPSRPSGGVIGRIENWSIASDGGIEGRIFDSDDYRDNSKIATSPIRGAARAGGVVTTGSGSKYQLGEEKVKKVKKASGGNDSGGGGGLFAKAFANAPTSGTQEIKSPAKASITKRSSAPKKAPRGVPRIIDWKVNGEGGISGRIVGSADFFDGETVSTSPIAKGTIDEGEVVTTGSGSKYFLEYD